MQVFYQEGAAIMTKHCCDIMHECITDPGIALFYSKINRRYSMPNLYQHRSQSMQGLYSCPWCATILPTDLGEMYDHILETEYGIEPGWDVENNPNLPEEFKSDEWWKRRNL